MKKSKLMVPVFRNRFRFLMKFCILMLLISFEAAAFNSLSAQQTQTRDISGTVTDSKGQPVVGASVVAKGTTIGINTDSNGKFLISVPVNAGTLVISFIGMKQQEVDIAGKTTISVQMVDETTVLEEVVVIGYGVQKRESVVAAITNTTEKDLQKRGGVGNLAQAMAGQLPGVSILERTGEPGKEDPTIQIRGISTWNNSSPLVLVDGIERRMNDINVNEIQSVSVLKDASATAVFGVRGANGVILVTTKRGELGKARLSVSASNSFKMLSKVTGLMESFSARSYKNAAVEHELVTNETAWSYITPYEKLLRYKKPQAEEYKYIYPNIDWADVMGKKFATDQNINLNLQGGTEFAKYFASVAYFHQGDIIKSRDNNQGYDAAFNYNRLNYRSNIDIKISPTTTFSTNLYGYVSQKTEPSLSVTYNLRVFKAFFMLPPDAFIDVFPDGMLGKNPWDIHADTYNPIAVMNYAGIRRTNGLFVGNDSKLEQNLDFITKGLKATVNVAFDNTFSSLGPNIQSGTSNYVISKYYEESILNAKTAADSLASTVFIDGTVTHGYDRFSSPWYINNESVTTTETDRNLYYKISLDWARSFDKHDLTALMLMSRYRTARGATFPSFREDWVGRFTYAYGGKYFAEVNGAYNGSEKFGPGYRFGFFPSVAAGWLVSKEAFMHFDWLTKLKLRANIGKIGSDAGISRWGYRSSWNFGGVTKFGNTSGLVTASAVNSIYTQYSEGVIANPDISWETAIKKDIGLELSLFKDKITLEADYFTDHRDNIFLSSSRRNIPVYFGADPVPINKGKTLTRGYEVDVTYKNKFSNGIGYFIRAYMTRARDKVLLAEDPPLQKSYLNTAGFKIGQTKTQIISSIANTWNDAYAQTTGSTTQYKLPGDYDVLDFNGDGLIDGFDNIAYGYSNSSPENTYSTFLGLDYKGFNFMVQFYGITNISRNFFMSEPEGTVRTGVFVGLADYWTPQNTDTRTRAPRILTRGNVPYGDYAWFDGSYLRLKTIELGYQLPEDLTQRLGLSSLRIYLNGNNLIFWSDVPEDSEYGDFSSYNPLAYPALRNINVGVDIKF